MSIHHRSEYDPEKHIYIYHSGIADGILGPGKRLVIWVSGCLQRCQDCIEPRLWDMETGTKWSVEEFGECIAPYIQALNQVTFSGGEPLLHAKALFALISGFDPKPQVMLYTGYSTETALGEYDFLMPLIDILVTEPYDHTKSGSYLWRGSANQKILSPSGSIDANTLSAWMDAKSAGIYVHTTETALFVYGVPSKGSLELLDRSLNSNGITLSE